MLNVSGCAAKRSRCRLGQSRICISTCVARA